MFNLNAYVYSLYQIACYHGEGGGRKLRTQNLMEVIAEN